MLPCSDGPMATGSVAGSGIVYSDEEVARLLAEVERRSGRRRRHRERFAQTAACLAIAMIGWLSSAPSASGQARAGHHPVAVSILGVERASPSGT